MLKNIRIKNLRGFRDFQMENLGLFNLFVGPNNLGKTTALEAIWSLLSLGDTELSVRISHWLRNAQMPDMDAARHILSSFFHKMKADKISLSGDIESRGQKKRLEVKIAPSPPPPVSQSPYTHPSNSPALPAGKLPFDRIQSDWKQSNHTHISGSFAAQVTQGGIEHTNMSPGRIGFADVPTALFCSQRDVVSAVASLQKSGKMESATCNIAANRAGFIRNFSWSEQRGNGPCWRSGNAYARHGGWLHDDFVCIGLKSPTAKEKIILMDEIATGVYFGMLPIFLRAMLTSAKTHNKQIFATTHSKDLLLALQQVLTENESLREDAVCFKFMRDKHGEVWANPYNYEAIDHCIESGIEIR